MTTRGQIDMRAAEALLGGIPLSAPSVSDALDRFSTVEAIGKFIKAVADTPYLEAPPPTCRP